MPKATLTFNLPEEKWEHHAAITGPDAWLALWDYRTWLRNQLKYNNAGNELEQAQTMFFQILKENEIDLDEMP